MKRLILIRGVSGSGKSTLAEQLENSIHYENMTYHRTRSKHRVAHLEADMYFIEDGEYKFDASQLGAAHAWCQERANAHMACGTQTVIVSNTFVKKWEMQAYLDMVQRHGYKVQEIICRGKFQNTHGLSEEFVQSKRDQFEY